MNTARIGSSKDLPVGGRLRKRAGVGAAHHRLDQDRVVGVMKGEQLVSLVREGSTRLLEVGAHLVVAVEDVAGPDQLVAGVLEGLHGRVVLVTVLGVHVLADEQLAGAAKL